MNQNLRHIYLITIIGCGAMQAGTTVRSVPTEQATTTSSQLRPEKALPDSAYKAAFSCCATLWYQMRKNQHNIVDDRFIDGLIALDNTIRTLAANPTGFSPDDIEHLAGSLNHMHMDYANTAMDIISQKRSQSSSDDQDAIKAAHYFFNRIKRNIELLVPN